MATILISDPSELLANRGQPNRGLSKHDDDRAADIQHTWWRAHNMDKLQKEQGLADLAESRQSGALTSIGAWLMVVGEKVRDRASWRKGVVIKVEEHTRVVRFDDNGAELTFQVDQLEIFAHDDKLALVFRDWFWSHTLRRIELPPPPPHGEAALCSLLNNLWQDQSAVAGPSRRVSPLEAALLVSRLVSSTVEPFLASFGGGGDGSSSSSNSSIRSDAPTLSHFSFELMGHSELPKLMSRVMAAASGEASTSDSVGQPWSASQVHCVPLWWDSCSANLRGLQALLRHRYMYHYGLWQGVPDLLQLFEPSSPTPHTNQPAHRVLKEDDLAGVLVLVLFPRIGPPPAQKPPPGPESGLVFDVPAQDMHALLAARDLIDPPTTASSKTPPPPLQAHCAGFSWPLMTTASAGSAASSQSQVSGSDAYYRHESRLPPPMSPEASAQAQLLHGCCCQGEPQLQWRREIEAAVIAARAEAAHARAEEEANNAAADMRAASALWPDEGAALRTASRRKSTAKARSQHQHQQSSGETGERSGSHEHAGLTPRSGQLRGGFRNDSHYDASRATESLSRGGDVKYDDNDREDDDDDDEDDDWRGIGGKGGFAQNESLTESLRRSKALLQTSSSPISRTGGGVDFLHQHQNDDHGGGSHSMTFKERSQKNSVVLSHTIGGQYGASYSDSFVADACLPVHHFYLAEPSSHGERGVASAAAESGPVAGVISSGGQGRRGGDDEEEGGGITHESVRPRKSTPRSKPLSREITPRRGGMDSTTTASVVMAVPAPFATVYQPSGGRAPDSPGRQAKAAAEVWRSKKPVRSSEPPAQRHVAQTVVAPRESSQLEASGGQLAFKSTAAKWAGSVGGYATYHTKSTTRTLNPTGGGRRSSSGGVSARGGGGGAVPTEHYGRWLEPGVSREGSRKGFDEGPSEISGRLQTHSTFKKGDQVRARAPDQKAAWFNATIVGVERDPSGDPAKHTYDVRFEGYKSQPKVAAGRSLRADDIRGTSSLKTLDR